MMEGVTVYAQKTDTIAAPDAADRAADVFEPV
jgi:hypothetical protein